MHPRILAARNQAAATSMRESARRIAEALGQEDASLFDGTWARDPEVRALFEREAIAAFLESVRDTLENGHPTSKPERAEEQVVQNGQPVADHEDETTDNRDLWAALPPKAREAFEAAGISSATEVAGMDDQAVLAIKGIGPKVLAGIREVVPAFAKE